MWHNFKYMNIHIIGKPRERGKKKNRKTFFLIKNMVNHSILYPEKAVAPHSSTLAWKIPWTEEPDRLQSMGSLRVGHD